MPSTQYLTTYMEIGENLVKFFLKFTFLLTTC
jgi:hypothetical protein